METPWKHSHHTAIKCRHQMPTQVLADSLAQHVHKEPAWLVEYPGILSYCPDLIGEKSQFFATEIWFICFQRNGDLSIFQVSYMILCGKVSFFDHTNSYHFHYISGNTIYGYLVEHQTIDGITWYNGFYISGNTSIFPLYISFLSGVWCSTLPFVPQWPGQLALAGSLPLAYIALGWCLCLLATWTHLKIALIYKHHYIYYTSTCIHTYMYMQCN